MTNSDRTHIAALVDRTGSMQSIKDDVEGAFNAFIEEQRTAGLTDHVTVSLYQFDSDDPREVVYENLPIAEVPPLVIVPRNSTPLHDAIGSTVTRVGEQLAAMTEQERPSRVYFVIMTDGQENASREWNLQRVRNLIERQTNQWNWQFHFIGVGIDAYTIGADYGFSRAHTSSVPRSRGGVMAGYGVASASIADHRSQVSQALGLPDDQDDEK